MDGLIFTFVKELVFALRTAAAEVQFIVVHVMLNCN
jgi:hypothetical protein